MMVLEHGYMGRPWPIKPKILPIIVQNYLSLLYSKLCFQNQDYAQELTVLLD